MTHADNGLPQAPAPADARLIDARLHLLDRQILDADDEPVGIVDDLEIEDVHTTGPPTVTAILTGQVLFTRIFGGQPPRTRLEELPWCFVDKVGTSVHLRRNAPDTNGQWVEHWLRDRIIRRIPGGRHAAE